MAIAFTNLNNYNIEALSEAISLTVGMAGELQKGVTVLNGIEKGKPILTFTAKDKALRKSTGCESTYQYSDLVDKVKYYDHSQVELPISICLQELWGKMVANGVHLSADFSETELAAFIQSEILKVLEADLLRLAWLDGTLAGNAAYTVFKNGGILQQAKTSTMPITAMVLTTDGVIAAFKATLDSQRADKIEESEFFVTSNVMRLYKNALEAKDNTSAQMILEDGRPTYFFEGHKINELRHVSASMTADKTDQSAFIAFSPKTNLQIALEDASLTIAPFIQDAKDRKYYSTTVFAADIMLAVPEFLRLATTAKV